MTTIAHYRREISQPPDIAVPDGTSLRSSAGPEDVPRWLAIRQAAFSHEARPVGLWTEADFQREFLAQPWWQPAHQWFAIHRDALEPVGTITLGRRAELPVIHWLA